MRRWMLVLALVGGCGGGDSDATDETDGADDTDVEDGAAPDLAEAGLCEVPERPWISVTAGTDLQRVTLDDPLAVCNDGTPAVLYISRPPEASPDADRWVIWLEGGGGCLDARSCADRWCGIGSLTDSPGKMSSRWAPDGIEGHGIFDREQGNPFRGWTHVVAYYCSSDNWSGMVRQDLAAGDDYPPYGLYLHGAHIVDAMIDTLKEGARSDDGTVDLPTVDSASQVVFAGTSAGGGGARYNADHVTELLTQTNPDVDVRLVVDAGFHPKDPDPPEVSEATSEAFYERAWDVVTTFREGRVDTSCVDVHASDPAVCAEPTHTLLHHIGTPWYVKMDLSDGANKPGIYPDDSAFTRAVYELVTSLEDRASFAEEHPALQPAAFAPDCGHHVNLEVDAFTRIALTDGERRVSNADHLHAWVDDRGREPILVHSPDGPWTSACGR